MDGHTVSSFDLSRTLPVGGGLLVPYSLSGPPVIKQLMQMVTIVPGHGGRFQSVLLPLTHPAIGNRNAGNPKCTGQKESKDDLATVL